MPRLDFHNERQYATAWSRSEITRKNNPFLIVKHRPKTENHNISYRQVWQRYYLKMQSTSIYEVSEAKVQFKQNFFLFSPQNTANKFQQDNWSQWSARQPNFTSWRLIYVSIKTIGRLWTLCKESTAYTLTPEVLQQLAPSSIMSPRQHAPTYLILQRYAINQTDDGEQLPSLHHLPTCLPTTVFTYAESTMYYNSHFAQLLIASS